MRTYIPIPGGTLLATAPPFPLVDTYTRMRDTHVCPLRPRSFGHHGHSGPLKVGFCLLPWTRGSRFPSPWRGWPVGAGLALDQLPLSRLLVWAGRGVGPHPLGLGSSGAKPSPGRANWRMAHQPGMDGRASSRTSPGPAGVGWGGGGVDRLPSSLFPRCLLSLPSRCAYGYCSWHLAHLSICFCPLSLCLCSPAQHIRRRVGCSVSSLDSNPSSAYRLCDLGQVTEAL